MADISRYYKARPSIQTGDLLTVSGAGTVSKLIKWRTGEGLSHVGMFIKLHDIDDVVFILQAHARTGVSLTVASTYLQTIKGEAYLQRVSQTARTKFPHYQEQVYWWLRNCGREYDFAGVISYILPWVRPKATAEYCSELVSLPWIDMGAIKHKQYTPGQIASEWVFDQEPVQLIN